MEYQKGSLVDVGIIGKKIATHDNRLKTISSDKAGWLASRWRSLARHVKAVWQENIFSNRASFIEHFMIDIHKRSVFLLFQNCLIRSLASPNFGVSAFSTLAGLGSEWSTKVTCNLFVAQANFSLECILNLSPAESTGNVLHRLAKIIVATVNHDLPRVIQFDRCH